LPAIADRLRENAELVANAITNGGNFERCQGVQVTRGQASETAVAEAGLLLLIEQHFQIEAEFPHRLLGVVEDAEIDQVVSELRTNQEFG
jgi:hypothetical protein